MTIDPEAWNRTRYTRRLLSQVRQHAQVHEAEHGCAGEYCPFMIENRGAQRKLVSDITQTLVAPSRTSEFDRSRIVRLIDRNISTSADADRTLFGDAA